MTADAPNAKRCKVDTEAVDAKVARHAISLIDHTSLGLSDTEEGIKKLVDQAVAGLPHTAAVCVYPKFVSFIRKLQAEEPNKYPRSLRVATVVNFPGGQDPVEKTVEQTAATVKDGADEVDLVIDYRLFKEDPVKGRAAAESLTRAVRAACPENTVLLKVIIESGELKEPALITSACEAAIAGGCDFVKTSTGKVPVNATPEAAETMLTAIASYEKATSTNVRTIGFKAAGGVKDLAASKQFLEIAARVLLGDEKKWSEVSPRRFRFGASSLLAALRVPQVQGGDSKVARHVISLIDHTSLGLSDTEEGIRKLLDQAVAEQPHTAAVCVYPKFVPFIRKLQAENSGKYPRSLRVATVVNFPGGQEPLEKVVEQTAAAVKDGADEVDLVIDYRLLKEDPVKGRAAAETLTRAVRVACPEDKVLLKVIVESGELQDPALITSACEAAIAGGCDFVKTSTGKVPINATPEAAEIMIKAIAAYEKSSGGNARIIGFKAAGGVKDLTASRKFLQIAAKVLLGDEAKWPEVGPRRFRFGASSLLAALRCPVAAPQPAGY